MLEMGYGGRNREELIDIKLTGCYNTVKLSNEAQRAGKNGPWMLHSGN